MSYESIAIIILAVSFLGMMVIIFRKIPALVELPVLPQKKACPLFSKLKEKIRVIHPFKSLSSEIFLQKILTKIRIISLKTDNKTFNWLQKLRERTRKKKIGENDNYWEEIKKTTKK